jgi:hypothetical protein
MADAGGYPITPSGSYRYEAIPETLVFRAVPLAREGQREVRSNVKDSSFGLFSVQKVSILDVSIMTVSSVVASFCLGFPVGWVSLPHPSTAPGLSSAGTKAPLVLAGGRIWDVIFTCSEIHTSGH